MNEQDKLFKNEIIVKDTSIKDNMVATIEKERGKRTRER